MSFTFVPSPAIFPRQSPLHHLRLHRRPIPRTSSTRATPTLRHTPYRAPATSTQLSAASPNPAQPASRSVPITFLNNQFQIPGRLLLSLVPLLMASFIACAKLLYTIPKALPPSIFNASRLVVSSLFFVPTLLRSAHIRTRARTRVLRAGAELGVLMFLANALQIAGLRYTEASRAAFLNQLSTVFVPLTAAAAGIEPLTVRVAAGAVCALAGVALLTLGSAAPPAAAAASRLGDALEVVSALLVTLYVLRVSHHARANAQHSGALVAVKVVTQALMSVAWLAARSVFRIVNKQQRVVAAVASVPWTPMAVFLNVLLVLWAGVLVSAATSWMQTKGQATVPPSETAILFAAQPLWASVFAAALLGETLGTMGMCGAGLIVAGTVVSSVDSKAS